METKANPTRAQRFRVRRRGFAFGVAAAALASLVAGLLILVTSQPWRSDQGPISASITLQASVALAEPLPDTDGLLQAVVLDTASDARRPVGQPDGYTALAWSPDGVAVAALAPASGPGRTARLHLLVPATGGETIVELPPEADAVFPAWSPDGSMLGVVGARVYVITRNGTVLSDTAAPPLAGVTGSAQASGGFVWSPDSRYLVTVINGAVILADRDGGSQTAALSALIPSANGQGVALLGWQGPSFVLSSATQTDAQWYEVRLEGTVLTAKPLPAGSTVPVPAAARPASKSALEEAVALVPGGQVFSLKASAEGLADVFEVRPRPDGFAGSPAAMTIVIRERESGAAVAVPGPAIDTRGGWLYDVYARVMPASP